MSTVAITFSIGFAPEIVAGAALVEARHPKHALARQRRIGGRPRRQREADDVTVARDAAQRHCLAPFRIALHQVADRHQLVDGEGGLAVVDLRPGGDAPRTEIGPRFG
jgi:hypothetical protein